MAVTLMRMWVFLDDRFVSKDDAKVSLFDLGFLRGVGIFEFARVYEGQVFCLEEHLDRFFASAARLNLQAPFSKARLEQLCSELIERCNLCNAGVKFVLSGGSGEFTSSGKATFAMMPAALREPTGALKVATACYERCLPECKTLNYLPAILERDKAIHKGFDEVLFLDRRGYVLEGARENFFAVKNGCVITPRDGVLPGVTRGVVMDMVDVSMRPIHYDELKECEGAFFTSTVREIAPIASIDDMTFDYSLAALQAAFKDRVCLAAQR